MYPLFVPFLQETCGLLLLALFIATTAVVVYRYIHRSISISSSIAITPTVEKYSGLLTPPASPAPVSANTNPYHDFLSSSLPAEISDAPAEVMQEVLFGDMEPGFWGEVLNMGGSFGSVSEGIESFAENDGTEMRSFMSHEVGGNGGRSN